MQVAKEAVGETESTQKWRMFGWSCEVQAEIKKKKHLFFKLLQIKDGNNRIQVKAMQAEVCRMVT